QTPVEEQLQARIEMLTRALDEANEKHQQSNFHLELNSEINQIIAATLDTNILTQHFAKLLKDHFSFEQVSLFLIDSSGTWLIFSDAETQAKKTHLTQQSLTNTLIGQAAYRHKPHLYWPDSDPPDHIDLYDTPFAKEDAYEIAFPLIAYTQLIGVLHIETYTAASLNADNVAILQDLSMQIAPAIEKTQQYTQTATKAQERKTIIQDIQNNLNDTYLMLDMSQQLSTAIQVQDIYQILVQSIMMTGPERCAIHICRDFDETNTPGCSEIVFVDDIDPLTQEQGVGERLRLPSESSLAKLGKTQETLLLNLNEKTPLSDSEKQFLSQFGTSHILIIPLTAHRRFVGLVSIEYRTPHIFTAQEKALYQALSNQATIAIESAHQIERTQIALAETQSLYRAGRVLAGTQTVQETLEEALIEFLYSLNLDQGAVTLVTPDKSEGQLVVYVENGQFQKTDDLSFPLEEDSKYQQILIAGQPFISSDVANDPNLEGFRSFNLQNPPLSLLEAPMIVKGETIGWIGADAVAERREFTQNEIDLARAMADQIAVTMQNHLLLEQTQKRAEQLNAVAQVGKAISELIDLTDILHRAVNLIRDQFKLYHVSIFLLDETEEWAVVRASTGTVGKIMVKQPHRFRVGSESIIGQATLLDTPQIVSDAEKESPLFDNFLLPLTRSEVALPLTFRGQIRGVLDVHSTEPNIFDEETVETLQIMADQLTAAIQNALLFQQTEQRLLEQATLYRIGTKIGGSLDIEETTHNLVAETVEALDVAKCALLLINDDTVQIISNYIRPNTPFPDRQGTQFKLKNSVSLSQVFQAKQEQTYYVKPTVEDPTWEIKHLEAHDGFGLAIVPILLRNEVIGFLEVYDHTSERYFRQEEIALLDSIALQAANAIENARLYQTSYESQAFMKSVIDEIPDPIFIKDRDHKWVVVNKAFSEGIIGVPEEKVIGKDDYAFFPKEEADFFRKEDSKVFEDNEARNTEETITDKDGDIQILYTRKIPFTLNPAESSTPDYLVGILNNITEQKETERYLRNQANIGKFDTEVGAALTQGETLQNTLQQCATAMVEHLGAAFARIWTLDQTGQVLELRASQGRYTHLDGSHSRIPVGQFKIGLIAQERVPHLTNDVQNDPRMDDLAWVEREGLVAFAGYPLIVEDQVLGVMAIFSEQPLDQIIFDGMALSANNIALGIKRRQLEQAQQASLQRTQSLYRISDTLATITVPKTIFEIVLGEYLTLLKLGQGSLMLLDSTGTIVQAEARHIDGQAVPTKLGLPITEDLVFQHLRQYPKPLVIEDPETNSLIKEIKDSRGQQQVKKMLFTPIVIQRELIGLLVADVLDENYVFSTNDIEIGEAISGQLGIWLENRRNLEEAQYRSTLLQTGTEVSRAASSILDVNLLIQTSVDLIGDQFDFYYVGIFLLDDAREWAVLQAGTGEAGRIQLGNKHRLATGGDSMIGWCVQNAQARIALDVGEEAVRFQNPILPDTRSEMALPLITRDQVIGALTVQSVEQGAFSDEDVSALQTMADQLANAIANARLFEQTQTFLGETEDQAQRITLLNELATMLSQVSDEAEAYQAIAEKSEEILRVKHISVGFLNEDDDSVRIFNLQKEGGLLDTGTDFPIEKTVIGTVLQQKQMYAVPDMATERDWLDVDQLYQTGMRSGISVPLIASGKVLGTLNTLSSNANSYTPFEERVILQMGSSLAATLENRRLLNQTQRLLDRAEHQAARLNLLNELAVELSQIADEADAFKV
ncbi:MAG: GAF domain-containing protein, partial [Chloroflexota bacterium]